MRRFTVSRPVRRRSAAVAALLAGVLALGACSSSSRDDSARATSAGSPSATASAGSASPTGAQDDNAPAPSPASTAQPPVASYPADPKQDPVVDLGPPPPAYQAPRPECPVEAKACVDLTNSMTWLQAGGTVTYGPVQQIAGRQGYRTTPGMHAVSWKNIDHVSSIFGTPMPYATFFTSTGIAFHLGELNIPSHGCVHLAPDAAAVYWDNLRPGDKVYVFGEAQY